MGTQLPDYPLFFMPPSAMFDLPAPIENRTIPGKKVQATIYPSGRFSIVQVCPPKRGSSSSVLSDAEKTNLCGLQAQDSVLYAGRPASGSSLLGLLVMARSALSEVRQQRSCFGSSNAPISNSRAARGSRGINPGQRDRLSWAIGLLERRHGKELLSFLTLTLPPVSPADRDHLRACWPEIVNRFIIYLKRSLSYRGIQTPVVGATEIQVKRSREEGWAVPHLHLVFRGRRTRRSCWAVTSNVVRRHWRAAIEQVSGLDLGDYSAAENLQRVRRSAARYLSKYLSKCASKGSANEPWYDWHPADWVILGRAIRLAYNALTVRSQVLAQPLLETLRGLASENRAYLRPLEVRWRGCTLRLGWVGTCQILATSFEDVVSEFPNIMGEQCSPIKNAIFSVHRPQSVYRTVLRTNATRESARQSESGGVR